MRILLAATVAALFLAPTAWADTVVMPDKVELSGKKIQILEIRSDEVVVGVAGGDITIPKTRVTAMKVEYAERLARLKEEGKDTPRALYLLGRVCSQLELPKDAAAAYREALARRDVPEDILLPMAADGEHIEAWDVASKCYSDYLKLHPDNADVQAKARAAAGKATLPAAETPAKGEGKIEITSTTPAVEKPVAEKPAPGEKPADEKKPAEDKKPEEGAVQEGLEASPGWSSEPWGSSVEVTVGAPKGATDKMVRVFLAGAEHDKACVMLQQDFDLTDKKTMTFEVYNFAKQSVNLAIAFITRPDWKFYESLPLSVLPTGDTPKKVSIDLNGNRFKTADTQWRHRSPLVNRNRIVKVYFLLYTNLTGEWVFFNNIRFEAAEAGGAAPAPAAEAKPEEPPKPAPAEPPKPAPAEPKKE